LSKREYAKFGDKIFTKGTFFSACLIVASPLQYQYTTAGLVALMQTEKNRMNYAS